MHRRCYTIAVPARHPRIAVVADPELQLALDRAATVHGRHRSRAALLRELALAGAATLPEQDRADLLARLASRHGVRPPRARLSDLVDRVAEMGPPDSDDPRPGQRALEEQRAERL